MKTTAFGTTNRGQRRDRNEDAFVIGDEFNLHVVCDGVGGHAAGDVAARKATEFTSRNSTKGLSSLSLRALPLLRIASAFND